MPKYSTRFYALNVIKTRQIMYIFVKEMCVEEVPEYYKLVLNTLCVTNFVTSSAIVLAVAA